MQKRIISLIKQCRSRNKKGFDVKEDIHESRRVTEIVENIR